MTTTDPTTQHTADGSTAYENVISWCESLVKAIDNVLDDHKDELRARDIAIYLDGLAFKLTDWRKHIVQAHESGKELCLVEETVSLLEKLFEQGHVQLAAVMENEPDSDLACGAPLDAMFTTLHDIRDLTDVIIKIVPVRTPSPYNSDEELSDYSMDDCPTDEDYLPDNDMCMRELRTRLDLLDLLNACATSVAPPFPNRPRASSCPVASSLHGYRHVGTPEDYRNTTALDVSAHSSMAAMAFSASYPKLIRRRLTRQ
ncbi:hypothetical protein LTR15_000590 [Elasticomyces elasticus]|nr:hypothetical protein LTR15_000590 [Elasticomyces elasticus]